MLSQQDRDAIAKLDFFARNVINGMTVGQHRSPHRGATVDFKEHRAYVSGDEIRSIDWKLFGKTDKLFVRQFEDETNLRCMLLLDTSGSMRYAGKRSKGLSKHKYATQLAACLCVLLLSQHDSVGLCTVGSASKTVLPIKNTPSHLQSVFQVLVQSRAEGETTLGGTIRASARHLKGCDLIVLISDCFDDVSQLTKAIASATRKDQQVFVLQVWDQDELEFPFQQPAEFRSLENSNTQTVDPQSMRDDYLSEVREFQRELKTQLEQNRSQLLTCVTNEPCPEVLAKLVSALRLRQKQARAR